MAGGRTHYVIWLYCQHTSKVQPQVLQILRVDRHSMHLFEAYLGLSKEGAALFKVAMNVLGFYILFAPPYKTYQLDTRC